MVHVDEYKPVNDAWPANTPLLRHKEAVSAAKRLYRFGMKKPWKGKVKLTSGNRYNRISYGVLYVNPGKGWRSLVHSLSHHVHRRTQPSRPAHGVWHRSLELEMIQYVLRSGWLDGKLRRD